MYVIIVKGSSTRYWRGYEVVTTPWYAVAQKGMYLHWFHHMYSIQLTDYHATAYSGNRKPCNCVSNCSTAYRHFYVGESYTKWRYDNCVSWRCHNLVSAPIPWSMCVGCWWSILHLAMWGALICAGCCYEGSISVRMLLLCSDHQFV